MNLSDDQIAEFHEQGYLLLPDVFSGDEIAVRQFKRPEWIAHRDFTAIDVLPDHCLLAPARGRLTPA